MSETLGIFLENLLPGNIVLMSFLGVLLSLVETDKVRNSLVKGVKFSLALLFAVIGGWVITAGMGLEFEFLALWLFALISLLIVGLLQHMDELTGDYFGLPKLFLFLPTLIGYQWLINQRDLLFSDMIIQAFAGAIGFYLVFVLIATFKEQIKISEANEIFKLFPTVLVALGVMAMAVAGFGFLY